ncbi:MAG: DUF547 domain-containing protein [Thermoanaerobaculia bacterium]
MTKRARHAPVLTGLALSALLTAACGGGTPVAVKPPEGDVPSSGQFPHATFSRVLEAAVSPDGLVDYAAVEGQRDLLDLYLGEVARISPIGQPHLFPTMEDQLAYWINAHNAAALKGVLVLGRPMDLSKAGSDLGRMTFTFGGRKMTLAGVAALIRRQFPDPRPFVVLVRGRRSDPPLDQKAFEAKDLEERLEAAARAIVKNPRYVQWTPSSKTVRVSRVLLDERTEFERLLPATLHGDARFIESLNHFLPGRDWILATKVAALPLDERLNDVANR